MPLPVRVLFVCVGNSCRSPMAEALARRLASGVIDPSSAGISPLGFIADLTRRVLLERGAALDGQYSKGLADSALGVPDLIVNMSGIPAGALFPGRPAVDWDVQDPYGEDLASYRRVCEDIHARIVALAADLRRQAAASAPGDSPGPASVEVAAVASRQAAPKAGSGAASQAPAKSPPKKG
jgi:arsenate reductase (thioredoxin)